MVTLLRLATAVPRPLGTVTASRAARCVRAVKELLASSPRPLSLGVIASAVGMSPAYLTVLFRRSEGMPIARYQQRLRLARALVLLADADDITRLALDLGFASHSHFTTAFRAVYGLPPSAHRAHARRVAACAPVVRAGRAGRSRDGRSGANRKISEA